MRTKVLLAVVALVATTAMVPLIASAGEDSGSDAGFTRIGGASRIETSVNISVDSYSEGAPAVLLANADNPVDALPASRSRFEGPILYVPSTGDLPQVVADEITRLQPTDIVVLGGPNAVSDEIAAQAVAAKDAEPAPERVQGTPNPEATPADEKGAIDTRNAEFALLDTRPDEGYEDAGGTAHIARDEAGVTVTIRVTGLPPNTLFNSHVHEGSCLEDNGGEHFMFDPDGGSTPPNEIHLPFMSDENGEAVQTSTHTEVPGMDARSIVVHPRDNGPARVMCAEWRVPGTANPAATPADELDVADVRDAEFALLDTRPEEGFEDAGGTAHIARSDDGTTVTIRVTGLVPEAAYNSHLHEGSCETDNGGEHFKFDADGGDTPPNEIHLPFTADAEGSATVTSTHTAVAGEDGRSIVVHPRENGPARVMCAEWPAT